MDYSYDRRMPASRTAAKHADHKFTADDDEAAAFKKAIKWMDQLTSLANKAKRSKSTGDLSYFVGHMKGYQDEDWYEYFWS